MRNHSLQPEKRGLKGRYGREDGGGDGGRTP
jgi:hypothetical protein